MDDFPGAYYDKWKTTPPDEPSEEDEKCPHGGLAFPDCCYPACEDTFEDHVDEDDYLNEGFGIPSGLED